MVRLGVVSLLAGLLLAGCLALTPTLPIGIPIASREVDVPFATVALEDVGVVTRADTIGSGTQLMLLTSPEQIGLVADMITHKSMAELQQVDFQQNAVVALFRGVMSSNNYQAVIKHITKDDDRLIVQAEFWSPSPWQGFLAATSFPYHLVQIDKQQLAVETPELVLELYSVTPTPHPNVAAKLDVQFETIARNEGGADIAAESARVDPQLLLLTSPEQLEEVAGLVDPQTMATLQQVNFQRYAVVAVFRGWQGSYNYQTIIDHIIRRGDRLIVHVQFWSPSPWYASPAALSFPYHLVKVDKQWLPVGKPELVLQSYPVTPTPPPYVTGAKTDIPFETIVRNEIGVVTAANAQAIGAQLLLLTSPEQLEEVAGMVDPQTMVELQQVDFQHYAVVALFRILQPSSNYQIAIERIIRHGDRLIVHAQFWMTSPQHPSAIAEAFPYHLVSVAREQLPAIETPELVLQWDSATPTPQVK